MVNISPIATMLYNEGGNHVRPIVVLNLTDIPSQYLGLQGR